MTTKNTNMKDSGGEGNTGKNEDNVVVGGMI